MTPGAYPTPGVVGGRSGIYALPEAGSAHTRAAQGHIQGKIVLTVDS